MPLCLLMFFLSDSSKGFSGSTRFVRSIVALQTKKNAWMEAFHHPPKSREGTLFGSNFVFFGFQQSFLFSFHFSREGGGQNFGQFFWPNDPGVEFLVILVSFVTLLRCFGSFLNSGRGDGGCFNGKTLIRKREPNKRTEVLPSIFFLWRFFLFQSKLLGVDYSRHG